MKIELDDETVERIVCATIKEHMKYAKKNIKDLKKKSSLKDFEAEDLGHNEKMLAAFQEVYGYFGGDL